MSPFWIRALEERHSRENRPVVARHRISPKELVSMDPLRRREF